MHLFRRILLMGFMAMLPLSGALASWAPTPAELRTLPPYCAARFDQGSVAFKDWQSRMGPDFIHIHHYCVGLKLLNAARSSISNKRNEILGASVREFDYVLTHAAPDFYMRPEILTNRGVALSIMTRDGEAIGNLLEAIRLDPKQPRAYMTLTDLYDKVKDRAKALETVSEGLRHNPDTKSLQRRYTELGGKLPFPEPIQAAGQKAVPQTEAPTSTQAAVPEVAPDAPAKAADSASPPTAIEAPKIGSPTNPYCRFCPD